MVGVMNVGAASPDIEASCAICGAPPYPECPHEGQRLQMAMDQALERWTGVQQIRYAAFYGAWCARILISSRDWVLNHARNQIIHTFQQLKAARYQAHVAYLQTIPCYTLYQTYNGRPPLLPAQIAVLHGQINQANHIFKQGIDDDWRRSCLQYPEVLDYFFSLVELSLPDERDVAVMQPRFGGTAVKEPKRVTQRRSSTDESSVKTKKKDREKDRRRDSGRTPPPAPMAGGYRR